MAESIVLAVIDELACFVTPFIAEKVQLQKSLWKDLESIRNDLLMITVFLKDAEDRAEESDAVKAWVRQVRNIAYWIQDVIDEHVIYTRTSLQIQNQLDNLCLSILYKAARCIKELKPQHKIASSIAEIKAEIFEIQRRKELFNLQVMEQGGADHTSSSSGRGKSPRIWQDPRLSLLYSEDTDFIGIEHPRSEIFELLDLESTDMKCSVIAMIGMGGIGKTTLAWKVYENVEVKRYFYVRAWINVSQCYIRTNLLKDMLQQFLKTAMQSPLSDEVLDQMDEMSLVGELRNFLQDKRYMVVFDDVWDPELWNNVKNALPNNSKGSKVLLTTRQETVALTWKAPSAKNYVYKLKLLPPGKAWELFCVKAFQGDFGGQCPQNLVAISHGILEKCGGLPLALVTVGGLLSTKKKAFFEWKIFRESLGSELQSSTHLSNIKRILLLSYNDLPHFMKPCLIYFSMFPEGSSIDHNRLLRLWIAEDFIRKKRGITIEDTAKEYLLELIERNLVQVSIWYDCGRARSFRVHDLLYEILREKMEEMNFCQILEEENPLVNMQSRRLSIQEGSLEDASRSITSKCSIRGIFLFGAQEALSVHLSSSLMKRIHLLKVLDLQGAPLEKVPTEVGDLFLLQYLSLRSTKVKSIPSSIGKLQNLITLDLKRCSVGELPVEIDNLRKLRHLVVYQNTWHNMIKVWVVGAMKIPGGALGRLKGLQKLADVDVAKSIGFMDQLSNFSELKYLAISNVRRENSVTLCKAIEKLIRLESLNITVDYESYDPLDLQHITSPPLQLQRLYLIGPLEKFPDWIGKLENLNKLRFKGSKLEDIPLHVLQGLPSLVMLGISRDVYYGDRLIFQEGGFKKVKAMYFDSLLKLNSIEIRPGSLPLLEDLSIRRSPLLKEPIGFQHLQRLMSLKIVEMPQEFVDSIQSTGSLHHMVKHVADIRVGYQTPNGHYVFRKL